MTPSNEMPLEIWVKKFTNSPNFHGVGFYQDEHTKYLRATPDKVMIDKKELERVREDLRYALRYSPNISIMETEMRATLQIIEAAMKGEK